MKSLIYCRVSSQKQVTEGSGLDTQEKRCRDYAKTEGAIVERVFKDEAISGGADLFGRPAMTELLKYLDDHPMDQYMVIFDDLKRFARDLTVHWKLRAELSARNAIIKCLNYNFDDSPEGKFIESVLAAQGGLEREQNKRQVSQKMKARLQAGYWTFYMPPGYAYQTSLQHGKLMVPFEPQCSILKEALESFANGVLDTQVDVAKFLKKKGFVPRRGKKVNLDVVNRILKQVLYTGYIHYPKWGIEFVKAQHEALISLEIYYRIQKRLKDRKRRPARKDISKDFPLRGFVTCAGCGRFVTGSWNKGKKKKYANYHCQNKPCKYYGKSLQRNRLEGELEQILQTFIPQKQILKALQTILTDKWDVVRGDASFRLAREERALKQTEKTKKQTVDEYITVKSPAIKQALGERIEDLEGMEALQQEKIKKLGTSINRLDFERLMEHSMKFIENPHGMWVSGDLEDKQLVLKLAFAGSLKYDKKSGYGTLPKPLLYKVLEDSGDTESCMVEMAGIEPASKKEKFFLLRS